MRLGSWILTALLSVALLLPAGAAGPAALDKVSPWALAATDDGGRADILVVLREQADLSLADSLPTRQARGRLVYQTLWETAQHSQRWLIAWLEARGASYRSYYIVNLVLVRAADQAMALALAARPEVARIEANPRVRAELPQPRGEARPAGEGLASIEWNIQQVNADGVWGLGYTGQGIVVGGQDTGYVWNHPALMEHYRGWDGATADHNTNWYDAVDGSLVPIDPYGHGTHTMGTVLGDDGAGHQIGMAPGARWIGCRNMDAAGYGTPASYLACFEFFLAPFPLGGGPGQGNPDLAPDVTNNSWGCPPSEGCAWDTLQAAVEAQRAAGIMTVSSAGNYGSTCSTVRNPPGIYDAGLTVGATDSADGIAGFSSRGPVMVDGSGRLKPDLSAPGVGVWSSTRDGWYGSSSGTSMASPHVAGAVALVWSARPALRNQIDLTEQVLTRSATPRFSSQCGDPANTVPNNVYGWGRLDALAAVNRALALPVGRLVGSVHESGAGPVAGATITATLSSTLTWTTTSDSAGQYAIDLLAGSYQVTATAPGASLYHAWGVSVTAGSTGTLDIGLSFCVVSPTMAYAPSRPLAGNTVRFSASWAAGTPPITTTWDLGDGSPLVTGNPISHTFPISQGARVYTVTLTADNVCQRPAVAAWTVQVWLRAVYLPLALR